MPEIAEVEKLAKDLDRYWTGRKVVALEKIGTMDPAKFVEGVDWGWFSTKVLDCPITGVGRLAKNLLIMLDGQRMWHIHLSSTGWLKKMGENPDQPSDREFIHSTEHPSHRIRIRLDDGQEWVYSDSRTWGRFYLRKGVDPSKDAYLSTFGPDWIIDPSSAGLSLITHKGKRRTKDVLCDQHLSSGLGNYLACEAAFLAGVHPHTRWHLVDVDGRRLLLVAIGRVIDEAMLNKTKEHWRVFQRAGDPCPRCKENKISYIKDPGGQRGSYFCANCQPYQEDPALP